MRIWMVVAHYASSRHSHRRSPFPPTFIGVLIAPHLAPTSKPCASRLPSALLDQRIACSRLEGTIKSYFDELRALVSLWWEPWNYTLPRHHSGAAHSRSQHHHQPHCL